MRDDLPPARMIAAVSNMETMLGPDMKDLANQRPRNA